MKKFIFNVLRLYIVIVLWSPIIWVYLNFERNTFLLYFLGILFCLLALGSFLYLTHYYKTDRDTD